MPTRYATRPRCRNRGRVNNQHAQEDARARNINLPSRCDSYRGRSAVSADRHVTNEQPPFAMVPEALLFDPAMSDKAVRLYGVLRRHGDDPTNCYPSKRRLADLMGCAGASLGRPLRELEDAGWIVRVPRVKSTGDPDSNGYHVLLTRTSSAGYAQVDADPPRPGDGGVRAPQRDEREPVNESQGTRELLLAAPVAPSPDLFAAFWTDYPRKIAKPEAEKAWQAMVVKPKLDPAVVLAGLAPWVAYWTARDQPEFVPHPSTWLRQQRWNDAAPTRPGRPASTGARAPITADRERPSGVVSEL